MARVPSLAQTDQPVHPLEAPAHGLAIAGRTCVHCGSQDLRPSLRRNSLDILLACAFLTPYRCRRCRARFYRFWRWRSEAPPDPPVAPLLVMPARRDVLNMAAIFPPMIEPEAFEPEALLPKPGEPRMLAPETKGAPFNPTFIQRLESGMRSPRPLPEGSPGTILIFEGDLSIRKLLRRLLERRSYTVLEISQPGDLQIELGKSSADLLVIDVSADSAIDFATLASLARAHPYIKVLALSARSSNEQEIPGQLAVLEKPFSLDRFVDAVDRLLDRPQSSSNGS
jgi:CheY-like chemotaxis protein